MTIDIPDPVYRRLKSKAASEGNSAKELILRGVEHVIAEAAKKETIEIFLNLPTLDMNRSAPLEARGCLPRDLWFVGPNLTPLRFVKHAMCLPSGK